MPDLRKLADLHSPADYDDKTDYCPVCDKPCPCPVTDLIPLARIGAAVEDSDFICRDCGTIQSTAPFIIECIAAATGEDA